MYERESAVAHVLRATGFGIHPGQVERWAEVGYDDCVEWVLSDQGQGMPIAGTGDLPVHNDTSCPAGTPQQFYPLGPWWFRRMLRPEARLHEKICLFWHSHFASSERVAEAEAMTQQHRLIRRHALGNFRALAREMLVDPAMLQWLDGDGSTAAAPNENLAREFMELFTLGTDPWEGAPRFTEDDVRAGARVLTGWRVRRFDDSCPPRYEVQLETESRDDSPVRFLGNGPRRMSAVDLADAVCDHPGTADFVARRLHRYFVGVDPSPRRARQLAAGFRSTGLEIRPLVASILRSDEFESTRHGRARWPVEWSAAAHVALGATEPVAGADIAADLGQKLAAPLLVNGWPLDDRWVGGGACARKAKWIQFRVRYAVESGALRSPDLSSPDRVLAHAGVWSPSDSSMTAVDRAWNAAPSGRVVATALETTLLTPEFLMS